MDEKVKKRLNLIDVKRMFTLAGAGCIIVLFYLLLGRIDGVGSVLVKIFKSMSPIIIGFAIAFLLNPIVNRYRVRFNKLLNRIFKKTSESKLDKVANVLAVVVAILVFLLIIVAFLWILIPNLYESITKLSNNVDKYTSNIRNWFTKIAKDNPDIINLMNNYLGDVEKTFKDILTDKLLPNMDTVVKGVSNGIVGGVKMVINFVVGIIAAIYILISKDKFSSQFKKLIYAAFSIEHGNSILSTFDYIDSGFSGFIIGKIIDSMIIGIICFAFCSIIGMPYAVLISVIVGITNIIPFFGPFIGAIPSAVLLAVESPKMCLIFIIFIIVLQQVDGNIIGPLILGDSTGLSSFWVLFAIIVGGNLFGFAGMLLGVPTFACIYTLATRLIRYGLNKKGLANDTDYFVALRGFDEDGNPIRGPKKKLESKSYLKKQQRRKEQLQHSKELIDKVTHKNSNKPED